MFLNIKKITLPNAHFFQGPLWLSQLRCLVSSEHLCFIRKINPYFSCHCLQTFRLFKLSKAIILEKFWRSYSNIIVHYAHTLIIKHFQKSLKIWKLFLFIFCKIRFAWECNANKQLLMWWLSKGNKGSINVISQHFTGKNIRWQTVRENVASVSDVIIKGAEKPQRKHVKDKGMQRGVGVVLEDVLVAWSVGPVPTKHLISLIKRTLAWYVLNSGDSGHVPSLHSPPLSHTHPDAAINHNNMKNKREKANSGQILKMLCFVIQQK